MVNPLDVQVILQTMADAAPTHPPGDATSDISSTYELLALLTHACMTSLKFRLLGFDEEKRIEQEIQTHAPRLPPSWNAGFGALSFVYAHKQTSMTDLINVTRMGSKAEIRGLAIGHDVIHRLEVVPRDYVNPAKLPLRITLREDGSEDRSDLPDKLKAAFVSEAKMAEIIELFKVNIIQKLVPKLQMEGYEESPDEQETGGFAERGTRGQAGDEPGRPFPYDRPPEPGRPYPLVDPFAQPLPPPRPVPAGDFPPPGFEDEYEINRPPRGHPLAVPGRSPYNIGHDDLNPPGLGPHDPLRPSFVGGGLPRPGGSSGMHPTFDDPLFGGPGAQSEYDPQAPPGARWDPVGPGGGIPRRGGGRGGSGRGQNPFGGGAFGGGFGGDII
ncbi:hypothetical protein SODALDRAFT_327077 [Sodiomyces alkalinus F11]|uniref:Uncharacterized protein n=1 Tax=Sodiomyces alkalinus (strain CBS 110278 / VKM F-3762 / F11) TaxID=1314773 RepID=A0A3N2Q802_SODAK|nr:hypothetical protein SODALDRAFT_327077 [Sodiomyces alkalinus F11]ROT42911.1 hypothetical protein SODALDRAFT_327077 [Sodiomyces alkalinus F11]